METTEQFLKSLPGQEGSSPPVFTSSKVTIETLEQGEKYVQS